MKTKFFQAVAMSMLLYGYTTWTSMKHLEKKLDGNYSRMLHSYFEQILEAASHKTATEQPPPISQTI